MHAVFLDRTSLDQDDLNFAAMERLCSWQMYDHTREDSLYERLAEATIVVSNKVVLDAAAMDAAPKLRLICIAATGSNNVDLEAARARGIVVCNVRGYGTASVVEHVFTLIGALNHRLLDYHRAVQAGAWQQSDQFCLLEFPIRELAGQVMGIVGYGELGKAVARLAEAYGMEVWVAQRPGEAAQTGRLPLHELLPRVDVLTLHCPLNASTQHLIGAAELALMKPDALLINTARGGIVDESALMAALKAGVIGGAGVDVLEQEPPAEHSPLLAEPLANLIVTPHIAWGSRQARQRLLDQVAEVIAGFKVGVPRNRLV